jgi:transposase
MHWALEQVVVNMMSIARVADQLKVAWNTANAAVLAEGHRLLIDNPARFDGVRVIGVDEHCWQHTRHGDKYVTVIIDLTPVYDRRGPSRLLDMVSGRSKAVFKTWLDGRPKEWRDAIEIVAMDGFTGFKTAAAEELPQATAVMDPFHVVRLAGDALNECRRRVQQEIHGRRGKSGDPLFRARNTLTKGVDLANDKQITRLEELFEDERHVEVEATWGVYQDLVIAYRQEDKKLGKFLVNRLITRLSTGVPEALVEIRTLVGTLKRRRDDVLAFFDRPGSSNGPTEAINGRLEHLRGIALGFRNLTHYMARSLLHSGGFRQQLHPDF